ncbi:MAG: LTA synthase family protein [Thermodesulfobacteriota bacterium]
MNLQRNSSTLNQTPKDRKEFDRSLKTDRKSFFKKLLNRWIFSHPSSFALFICLLALILAYRVQLFVDLFTHPIRPFDFNPDLHPFGFILCPGPQDLILILALPFLSWSISRISILIKSKRTLIFMKALGLTSLHLLILILTLIHGIHERLLFEVQSGLDYSMIAEAFTNFPLKEAFKLIEAKDILFLILPIGLFSLLLWGSLRLRIWGKWVSFSLFIFLLFASSFLGLTKTKNIPSEIRFNPAVFFVSDLAKTVYRGYITGQQERVSNENKPQELANLKLSGLETLPAIKKETHWNLVLLILESVGTRYIFDTQDGPMPMPFLYQLSKKGWFLKKHFTTSNVSTKAIFSILSGLYDLFGRETFCTRPDIQIPSLSHFLGENYDSFLITPSSSSWYFPVAFVKKSGWSEIHTYENLNFNIREERTSLGRYITRDEIQTVDWFIQRLRNAREPFFGIYISFTAHFPYFDYGETYRIRGEGGSLKDRYYNNLHLLDHLIQRVYEHLQNSGQLDRTLLIIVGDHGQAFGQHHPNNYMHYRYSYNENLETPAILYQPRLFKPREVDWPTSHVDLPPTLLEAMGIPYDPTLFDGESLFHTKMKKRTIFFYGLEGCISSLDQEWIKTQHSLKDHRSWAFDLKADPEEKNPLEASRFPLQLEHLLRYTRSHDQRLVQYNDLLKEKRALGKN